MAIRATSRKSGSSRKPAAPGGVLGECKRMEERWAAGTSKQLSFGDFLARYDDPRAFDGPGFMRALARVFGKARAYCFWHAPSGQIVVAYSGSSGPSFGAGVRYFQRKHELEVESVNLQTPLEVLAVARALSDLVTGKKGRGAAAGLRHLRRLLRLHHRRSAGSRSSRRSSGPSGKARDPEQIDP